MLTKEYSERIQLYSPVNSTLKCNPKNVCSESGAAAASPLSQTKMRSTNDKLNVEYQEDEELSEYLRNHCTNRPK